MKTGIDERELWDDNLNIFKYDRHIWEVGYFGVDNNIFSAFGFRVDHNTIRVTSKYEADTLCKMLKLFTKMGITI